MFYIWNSWLHFLLQPVTCGTDDSFSGGPPGFICVHGSNGSTQDAFYKILLSVLNSIAAPGHFETIKSREYNAIFLEYAIQSQYSLLQKVKSGTAGSQERKCENKMAWARQKHGFITLATPVIMHLGGPRSKGTTYYRSYIDQSKSRQGLVSQHTSCRLAPRQRYSAWVIVHVLVSRLRFGCDCHSDRTIPSVVPYSCSTLASFQHFFSSAYHSLSVASSMKKEEDRCPNISAPVGTEDDLGKWQPAKKPHVIVRLQSYNAILLPSLFPLLSSPCLYLSLSLSLSLDLARSLNTAPILLTTLLSSDIPKPVFDACYWLELWYFKPHSYNVKTNFNV
jgi:hypothetical protein